MYPSNSEAFGINYATKGYNTRPARVKRIDFLGELVGRKIKMFVPGENKADERTIEIKKVYPFMALGEYKCGKEQNVTLRVGLSISDLVEKGVITFDSGYPEVIGGEHLAINVNDLSEPCILPSVPHIDLFPEVIG